MTKRPKLMVIDGNALFYRAYHALANLTAPDGSATGGVYGFAQMVLKAYGDLKPDYAILTWDKAKTAGAKRLAIYPEYKAKRVKMPDDFYSQIPLIQEFAAAMGMPFVEIDNYEADDIIGTIIQQADANLEVIILTNDRDAFQLLDNHPHVAIYTSRRGMTDTEIVDTAKVAERYGIKPDQIIDLKALAGDASDNIPGVPGVGEKTALSLIGKYDSLDRVYQHLDEIQGKLQERLRDHRDQAYLSYKLATIICDAPYQLDMESSRTGRYNKQALHDLFRRLGFKSLLAKLPADMATAATPTLFSDERVTAKSRSHLEGVQYTAVQNRQQLQQLVERLSAQPALAFDVETDALDVISANLVGLAFSYQAGQAYYVPLGHNTSSPTASGADSSVLGMTTKEVIEIIKPLLEDPKVGKVGHNLKFDYQMMRRYGVRLGPIVFDTLVAGFMLNPLARAQTLSDLAYAELGIEMIEITELIGKKGRDQISFDAVTVEDATRYAGEDADVTWRLYQVLAPRIQQEGFERLAQATEWPLIPVLGDMELAGIALDTEFLAKFNKQISAQILKLEETICQLAGERFNIGSPSQLSHILYQKLGLSAMGVKRGKTGVSTAAGELEKLRGLHPIVEHLFEYRELTKLKSTYIDALPRQVAADGRLHTSFSQTIAQTGRLSSNNPNLQNIPVRTEIGRQIRQAFVAPAGRVLVSADYSQIELRVAAALSKDQAMIETFKKGEDLHVVTAAELFGVPLEQVTKQQRYAAKTINFGVLYGMSPHGLSVATGMGRDEAAGFIKRYYDLRPKLRDYIETVKAEARQNEYVSTLLGRKRPCGEINSNNHMIASAAERMAVNVPIQGTAADIMKLAMVKLASVLKPPTQLLLQIHDELIAETDAAEAKAVAGQMRQVMEDIYDLGVPLVVETAIGHNWGELK